LAGYQLVERHLSVFGIAYIDLLCARPDSHCNDSTASHCHPFAATPISKMGYDQLFCFIANYDNDRERSKKYISDEETDFVLGEIAYRALCVYLKTPAPQGDLVRLMDAISRSKYLSANGSMYVLARFMNNMFNDPNYHADMAKKHDVDAIHAQWKIEFKLRDKATDTLKVLRNEIDRFSACSALVKNGQYRINKPVKVRELTDLLDRMQNGELEIIDGLNKIIESAHDHKTIQGHATKLRNILAGSRGTYQTNMSAYDATVNALRRKL